MGNLESVDAVCRALAERVGRARGQHRLPARARAPVPGRARRRARGDRAPWTPTSSPATAPARNLAAVVALRLRDRIKLQLLVYPVTDAGLNTPSYGEFDERFGLTAAAMQRFWRLYLDGAEGLQPDASPLRATDLEGAPPAYVLTASHDVLRDEGEAYAAALERAGVAVELDRRRGRDPRLLALADDGDRARRGARGRRRGPRCARLTCHGVLAPVRGHGRGLAQGAGHRARRGPVGLRRRRRAATSTAPRRSGTPTSGTGATEIADAVAAQMKRIEAYHTFGDLANRPANEVCEALAARAPMPNAKVFLTSGGGDSIEVAAKLARRHFLQQRPARARAPDLAHPGLPRHARLRHLARRDRGQRDQLGPARPADLDRPVRLAARAGGGDPPRRAGQGRRVLLRAGDRRRRRPRPARRLHPGRRRPLRRARDPARDRRRDLRLRPARHVVRRRALGGRQAGHDHVRQGRHLGLPAARRRGRQRERLRAVLRGARRPDVPPRRHLRRPSDASARPRSRCSTSTSART